MMLIKFIGAALVLLASAAGGLYFGAADTFRQNDLIQFKQALAILKGDIGFALSTLPEAMAQMAARTGEPLRRIFGQFSLALEEGNGGEVDKLWARCLDDNARLTYFNAEDLAALKQFGKALGFLDKNMQLGNIEMTTEYLDAQIAALNDSKRKSRRMYQSLCVLTGLLVVVILF